MDALVYEDSPLATYFEGEAIPYDVPKEPTPPHTPFAPRGLPNFKDRLHAIRRSATSIAPPSSEQILEQFRYIIVASQLLSDDSEQRTKPSSNESLESKTDLLQGAVITGVLSFLIAWGVHWLKRRGQSFRSASPIELGLYLLLVLVFVIAAVYLGKRRYTKYIQKSAAENLSLLIDESHRFDGVASNALRFIQEVELVSRGYGLGSPLPPVTRLEDRQAIRRCRTLRSELANTLCLLITLHVESHNAIQHYVNTADLQRYHDIYEISSAEYTDAIRLVNEASEDTKESLKELRFSLRLLVVARKVFLCDLLAMRTTTGWARVQQWATVLRLLREIAEETSSGRESLASTLRTEEWGSEQKLQRSRSHTTTSTSESTAFSPLTDQRPVKARMRRFDELTNSIRALNARVHVLKEEIAGLTAAKTDDTVVSAALTKHYESLGSEIRSLQTEWERGRHAMLLSTDTDMQTSRASSGPRSPVALSPSPGAGLAIIDGGPAEAFRLLNGDDGNHSSSNRTSGATTLLNFDEEVFEAMSKPRNKRMSMGTSGMTREEKIAKLQEDRRKRATLHEQAETTTNMLRELQMVIKHRPHTRSPSTPVGKTSMM